MGRAIWYTKKTAFWLVALVAGHEQGLVDPAQPGIEVVQRHAESAGRDRGALREIQDVSGALITVVWIAEVRPRRQAVHVENEVGVLFEPTEGQRLAEIRNIARSPRPQISGS